MQKRSLRKQKGFTLIEIIAVLVILGILAAVAVPKFMGMQEDAKNAAGQGALAAASTNITQAYAKLLVTNTAGTSNAALLAYLNVATNNLGNLGDYYVVYTAPNTRDILITLAASSPGKFGTPSTKTITVVQ